ncbi:MAG: T9SS type A sorting domain-containing protein [Bacteroidales bacterium]
MKKELLIAFAVLISNFGFAQTTATNFNCNDCAGVSHDLFSELNAGKVIVICWVMPCAACISPSRTAYDAVQSYATSNPGRVVFYLADDYADTPCNTLTSWGNINAMPNAIKFSNSAVNPADYGTVGMPKIIVLGSASHTVYYNENNGANPAGIHPAINQALAVSGIDENNNIVSELNIFPNTIKNKATLVYNLNQANSVCIEIIDITGKIIKIFSFANQTQGKHETQIDFENCSDGLYFLKFYSGGISKVVKFFISH